MTAHNETLVMDSAFEEEEILLLAAAAILLRRRRARGQPQRTQRTVWSRQWLLRRPTCGQYEKLLVELLEEDRASYKNFLRVDPDMFQELLQRVGPYIEKQDTFFRKALEPGLRLAVVLRYLASGDSYMSLQYGFRVAHNTISKVVVETCEAIIAEYQEEVMPAPSTPQEWKTVAESFATNWNFYNCLGAIDGKHINIRCPPNGGSLYYNYKGFHSIVLMAVVDGDYKFIYVDVGANGSCSDGGVFINTSLREAIEDGTAGIPDPQPLPNDDQDVPFAFVGDDAFPLRSWLMKPFPHRQMTRSERIFNYRLSRARRVVENAFGILAHR
jgi:hypothetical protein